MDNDLIRENSEKKYTYSYGDGTNMTICANMFSEEGRKWIELLIRMDMDEEANNKKESRRHCSFEAFDPEGDTLPIEESMEEQVTGNEMTAAFVRRLTEQEKHVYIGRFIEQLTQEEMGARMYLDRSVVSKIEKRIREKYKKFNKF